MKSVILGLSAYYHDSAAALVVDGEIVAAAQEERFTRIKHDSSFPAQAVRYVLDETGYSLDDVEIISFYDKPFLTFERLLETYHAFAPKGLKSFITAIPVWTKEKLFLKRTIKNELSAFGNKIPEILFQEHHVSHAASAFFPSPYYDAAILTIDGVGEWTTAAIGVGEGNSLSLVRELQFPHSVGLLYSAFTYYCGFKVNSGEYKLMGLAPYGDPDSEETKSFKKKILSELVDIKEDGSIILNMHYFDYATGLKMCNNRRWQELFNLPPRKPETPISTSYMNMAFAIQDITETIVLKLANTAKKITGKKNLVMAGGVALNCVANGKLLHEHIFDNVWIQPASGDAGGAIGAALAVWYIWKGKKRNNQDSFDSMNGAFLGPSFTDAEIEKSINKYEASYIKKDSFDELASLVAGYIAEGAVVGWFQGRMEFGPRALGNRSILGDARCSDMQKKLNLKIKYREGFRPFAPSVIEEDSEQFFELKDKSPYMLFVSRVKEQRCYQKPEKFSERDMLEQLYFLRSDIPAVTHIDYSARIQTVSRKTNERFWKLLSEFKRQTGYGIMVNTSFNVRGEPIVCSPVDAYKCFMKTEMDYLVMGNLLFCKKDQPENNIPRILDEVHPLD